MARRQYTLEKEYDIDEVFPFAEPKEESLTSLLDKHITRYRTKTVKSGDVLECEIYPIWDTKASMSRAPKRKKSSTAQKNLNDRNAIKSVTRLVNSNFTNRDIGATFTYDDEHLPKTATEAEKIFGNFLRRLKYYGKKHGFPPLKYIYITHFDEQRVNHHIFTNFPDRDIMEKLWTGGARTQTRRLQADKNGGYEGAVRYCMQDPKGKKKYKASKNLDKPVITVADTKFTRKKVNKLVRGDVNAVEIFERLYPGYDFTFFEHKVSDYVSGAYLYVKMAKKKPERGKKNKKQTKHTKWEG